MEEVRLLDRMPRCLAHWKAALRLEKGAGEALWAAAEAMEVMEKAAGQALLAVEAMEAMEKRAGKALWAPEVMEEGEKGAAAEGAMGAVPEAEGQCRAPRPHSEAPQCRGGRGPCECRRRLCQSCRLPPHRGSCQPGAIGLHRSTWRSRRWTPPPRVSPAAGSSSAGPR